MPRQYVWVRADEIWPPEFHRLSHASVRKRGSTTTPDWTNHPGWTHKKPLKKWARRCIEKWCLLPPYDTTITEPQWMAYYEERCALDRVNTKGSADAEPILSEEELVQDTWTILRKSAADVAAAILGSLLDDEERKKQIARTLMGSLYFTSLWGNDEGQVNPIPKLSKKTNRPGRADEPDPRNVDAKTRLYSPFGLGTSIDFHYDYYFRLRWQIDHERSSLFNAVVRTIKECNAEHPLECAADSNDEDKISNSPAAFTLFERSDKFSQVNNEIAVTAFEEPLLGCKGWLSPLKMADLLLAAGTVMHYHERDTETPQSFADELYYFPKETKGKVAVRPELAELAKLEAAADEELEEDEEVCIPQRLLLLARQNWR